MYKDIEDIIKNKEYDIEKIISNLCEGVNKASLKEIIENKIKQDFMVSICKIIAENINKVCNGEYKSAQIFNFLKKFSNYFILNYDQFLYLYLMKF